MKALITGAAQDGGLIAARSLAGAGFSVIGTDLQPMRRGFRSRYMTAYHHLTAADEQGLDDALLRLVDWVRPDVFLPLGTQGVRAAARRREALTAMTAVNVVDEASFMAAFNKRACIEQCRRLGIDCVRVYELEEAMAALERSAGAGMLVVKPPWDAGAARGVCYVRQPDALRQAVERCSRIYGGALIQDYIPGGADAMKTVLLLFTPQSDVAAAFTMQKIRHWPQTGGATAAGLSTADTTLVDLVLPFFRAWRWRGPAEVELKLDPRDGRHKVIEINPRFPAYLRFPWHCGLDLPLLAAWLALGDPRAGRAAELAYRVGRRYVAPTLFARTVGDDIRTIGLRAALGRARADLRGAAPVILSMLADPLPLLARMLGATPPPGASSTHGTDPGARLAKTARATPAVNRPS